MTLSYVPVSTEQHRHLRWQRYRDFSHARELQFVDIALPETPKLCMVCPILFRQVEDMFVPIALMGIEPNQNVFLSPDFRWIATYTPALLRGHPFRVMRRGQDQFELQVESSHVSEGAGEPFFLDEGAPAPALQQIIEFLRQVEAGRLQARLAAGQLAQAGLLVPLTQKRAEGQPPEVINGIFTVDEAALTALSDAAFAALRGSGALKFAYHQMLSLEMWPNLLTLANHQRAHRETISQRAAAIYQPADDGELQIDWSQFKPPPS